MAGAPRVAWDRQKNRERPETPKGTRTIPNVQHRGRNIPNHIDLRFTDANIRKTVKEVPALRWLYEQKPHKNCVFPCIRLLHILPIPDPHDRYS